MKVIGTAEATAIIADYFDLICDTDYVFDESEILRRLNANAVDAELVRYGKWVHRLDSESIDEEWVCSECNGEEFARTKFCPHCGARMDADEYDAYQDEIGGIEAQAMMEGYENPFY